MTTVEEEKEVVDLLLPKFPMISREECQRFVRCYSASSGSSKAVAAVGIDGADRTSNTTPSRHQRTTKTASSNNKAKKQQNQQQTTTTSSERGTGTKSTAITKSMISTVEMKLQSYVEWRSQYDLDNITIVTKKNTDKNTNNTWDSDRWNTAFCHSLRVVSSSSSDRNTSSPAATENDNSSNSNNHSYHDDDHESHHDNIIQPQVIFEHHMRHQQQEQQEEPQLQSQPFTDKDGYTILHVLPARINVHMMTPKSKKKHSNKTAKSSSTTTTTTTAADIYSVALAAYLELHFNTNPNDGDDENDNDDDDDETRTNTTTRRTRRTVLLDVRPGTGWDNPPALSMIGFIKCVVQNLQGHYPERLHRLVVYPIPRPAYYIWNMIKWIFDANMISKIILVPGSATDVSSPLPIDYLTEWFDPHVLEYTEQFRTNLFVPSEE